MDPCRVASTAALALCALAAVATAWSASGGAGHARSSAAEPPRLPGDDTAAAVAIQRDGKIVAAGESAPTRDDLGVFALARYRPAGRLDRMFGARGRVLSGSGEAFASEVAIQGDGKVVAVGRASGADRSLDFAVARFTRDGRRDPSFGRRGQVRTSFGSRHADIAMSVAIQRDGKIVAAGWSRHPVSQALDVALARYLRDGRLDPSFGTGGRVLTDFGPNSDAAAAAVAIQADGKVVVAGSSNCQPIDAPPCDVLRRASTDIALTRYTTDGRLDPTFGEGGKVLTDLGSESLDDALAVAVQADGKILAAGRYNPDENNDFALARYLPDGRVDASFGGRGFVLTDFGARGNDWALGVAVQRDGRIIAAGESGSSLEAPYDFALARYTADGRPDPSFGDGGEVLTDVGRRTDDRARALALQRDGRIVVAGRSARTTETPGDFALARYTANGRLDPTFSGDGKVLTDFAHAATRVASLSAATTGRGVLVRWRTASERGTRGFNVYRQTNRRVRVNRELVFARGSATRGASYSFLDRRAPRSRSVRYWVEDVRHDGRRVLHGPARVRGEVA